MMGKEVDRGRNSKFRGKEKRGSHHPLTGLTGIQLRFICCQNVEKQFNLAKKRDGFYLLEGDRNNN